MNKTTKEAFLEAMEKQFGSDEALGVWFEVRDEAGRTLEKLSPAANAERMLRLGLENPDASAYLPHGGSATCCTDYAMHIYLALPGRVVIFGFSNEDNPTSRFAQEAMAEGHDFAIVDKRYIVDPWPRLVPAEFNQMVFDLEDAVDAALVLDIYGPRDCWEWCEGTEKFANKEYARSA